MDAVLNSMAEGVVVYDGLGKIIRFNQAALKILGLTEEEVFGKSSFHGRTINEDMTPVDPETYPSMIVRKTGGSQYDRVFGIYQFDGSLRWVSVNAVPLCFDKSSLLPGVLVTFKDITYEKDSKEKLRLFQKELQKSRSFLNNTLDALPVLVSYVDKDLIYRYVNQMYERQFGRRKEEILGSHLSSILGSDGFESIRPYLDKVLKGEPQHFESRINIPGKGRRMAFVTFRPDINNEGVHGYYGIIEDVTDIVRAKEEFQRKEEEQTRILDSVHAFIGHWNKDLINIHANRAYAEFLGKTREEIIGKHFSELYSPDLFEDRAKHVENVLKGEPQTFERETIDHEGNKYHIMVTYLPELKNGQVVGFFIVGSDVTQIKRSEAKFKTLLEISPDPTVILNKEGKIELINKQTEIQFGYKKHELTGRPIRILSPERFIPLLDAALAKYIQAPSRKIYGDKNEIWARRKDGTEFPFEVSLAPLQTEGSLLITCVMRDISERVKQIKEKERLHHNELNARKKAEMAIKRRDEMLAVVSHDLRNPLSVILGNIDLLIKIRAEDSDLRNKLEKMKHSSNIMLNMIEDLLDIYKMEEGDFDIASGKSTEHVEKFVRQLFESQELLANKKNISLKLEIEEDLPTISINANLITRVIQNLIGNSIKFVPPGGSIKLSTTKSNGEMIFSVQDTGSGIDKDLLPFIFDRFSQAKKTSHLGAGLGLAICKAIVEAHGGRIWIESESGKGCKVFFSLPIGSYSEVHQFH